MKAAGHFLEQVFGADGPCPRRGRHQPCTGGTRGCSSKRAFAWSCSTGGQRSEWGGVLGNSLASVASRCHGELWACKGLSQALASSGTFHKQCHLHLVQLFLLFLLSHRLEHSDSIVTHCSFKLLVPSNSVTSASQLGTGYHHAWLIFCIFSRDGVSPC